MIARQKKSFFTLLEVIVSMGVFAILMLALMQFFTTAKNVWDRTGTKTQLYDSTRIAMNLLAQDLSSAFYGDEYNIGTYSFFDYNSDATQTQITFATQRTDGMTEVNYVWTPATFTLSLTTILETDPTNGATGTNGWCTRPISPTSWITTLRAISPVAILDNILLFHVICKDYGFNDVTSTTRLPPYMVEITMAVVDQSTYDTLNARIKARLGAATTEATVKASIKTTFDGMLNSISMPQNGFKASSNFAEGSEALLLYQGTQFFKRIVIIDRCQY